MKSAQSFQLIPVIDLKDGYVVHAIAGKRDEYRGIHEYSTLVQDSSIDCVILAFQKIFPFNYFYIADLNAICKTGNNQNLILDTLANHTECEFWIDNGQQQGMYSNLPCNYKTVYGTEVQQSELHAMEKDEIISLDFLLGSQLGPSNWFNNHLLWSKRVIIMNLDHVGTKLGPDYKRLNDFVVRYPRNEVYAAGGIRNNNDIRQLKNMGVAGVLLSSALHQGKINFSEI